MQKRIKESEVIYQCEYNRWININYSLALIMFYFINKITVLKNSGCIGSILEWLETLRKSKYIKSDLKFRHIQGLSIINIY